MLKSCRGESRPGDGGVERPDSRPQGRGRWRILLAAHLAFLLWEGLCKSLGVLLQSLSVQLDTETWQVGAVVGAMVAARGFSGLLLSALESRCRYHYVAFVSGLVGGVGVIAASFASSVLQLTVCLVVFTGPAFGLVLNTSLILLGQNFKRLYACANGVAYAGASLGILLFTPMTQVLLETYGVKGALLLVGGMQLHLAAFGGLMRAPDRSADEGVVYSELQTDEELRAEAPDDENRSRQEGITRCANAAGLELFCELSYLTLIACSGSLCFVNVAWLVYMVPHLTVKGQTPSDINVIVAAGGIGILAGQLGHGLLVDFKLLKGRTVLYAAIALTGLTMLLDPLLLTRWPLALNNFVFGVGLGVAVPLTYTVMRDAVGVDRMTSAVGWAEMVGGIFRISSSFLTGWFYDQIGSYDVSYILLGSSSCCVFVILLLEDVYRALRQKLSKRQTRS